MRIVGEIPHPMYKITLLHMNGRYDIQIEYINLTQHYKVRESMEIDGPHKVKALVTDSFLAEVKNIFDQMSQNRNKLLPEVDDSIKLVDGII